MSPKSTAPRLSKLAEIPACSIRSPANNRESGMAAATTNPARRFPRKANGPAITSNAPASKLCFTVWMTLFTNSVRSYSTWTFTSFGRVCCTSASLAFRPQVTSALFSPINMKPKPSTISPLPPPVTAPRRISWSNLTSATSRTRTGTPSAEVITILAISSTLVVSPSPWTRSDSPLRTTWPPPTF